jgi:hypothetical protein
LKAFPVTPGRMQGSPFSLLLFSTVVEILIRAIKKNKELQIGKEDVKLSIFANILRYI